MKDLIRLLLLTGFLFLLSCDNKEKDSTSNGKKQSDEQSMLVCVIDSLENEYYTETKRFRNSIIDFTENEIINLNQNTLLYKSLSGNQSAYKEMSIADFYKMASDTNSYKYSYYIASKYNLSIAYLDVYMYFTRNMFYTENKITKRQVKSDCTSWSLDHVSKEKRDLALLCLIEAYKGGETITRRVLKDYFKKGCYFPRDTILANEL